MSACLSDLADMWEQQAWRAHAQGRTEAAQALRRCADQLTHALDPDVIESCDWPPMDTCRGPAAVESGSYN